MSEPVADPLVTDRLVLAPLHVSDAQQMQVVLGELALYRFTGGAPPSLEELERRFAGQIAGPADRRETWHNWIIHLAEDGSAVGFVQATVTDAGAQIAWLVGVPWQGRGIATEATIAMCAWLRASGVERMVAHIHPDHVASVRVATAVGLAATGRFDDDGEQIWSTT